MNTPKQKFLDALTSQNPVFIGPPWDCFIKNSALRPTVSDAATMSYGNPGPGQGIKKNNFGYTLVWREGAPGSTPFTTKDNICVKNIADWESSINFPEITEELWAKSFGILEHDLENIPDNKPLHSYDDLIDSGLSKNYLSLAAQKHLSDLRHEKLLMVGMFTGPFEFSHMVLGFEEALVNYLLEPELMSEMLSAYADWKIKAFDSIYEHLHPDIIQFYDDWGNSKNLFLNPDTWREIIKPLYSRIYSHMLEKKDIIIMHHADCVADIVAEDMVELGIHIWQGVVPQNDIKGVIEKTNGQLFLMGGIDMQKIDMEDTPEEVIREEIQRTIRDYVPLGHFMPCVSSIASVYKRTDRILNDELKKYAEEFEKNIS